MCKIEDLKTELKDLQCKYTELQRKLYITEQVRDAVLRALPDCNSNDCDSYDHADNCALNQCPIEYVRNALKEAISSMELHANINSKVAAALGQDFGESWHNLGEKVAALKAIVDKNQLTSSESRCFSNTNRNIIKSEQLKQQYDKNETK